MKTLTIGYTHPIWGACTEVVSVISENDTHFVLQTDGECMTVIPKDKLLEMAVVETKRPNLIKRIFGLGG